MLLPGVGALVALLGTGCLVSLEPQAATNFVGEPHTVTAEFDLDFIEEILSEELRAEAAGFLQVEQEEDPWQIFFAVTSGPNAGTHSDDDCDPGCDGNGPESVSWTYRSNGVAGVDTILACVAALGNGEFDDLDEFLDELQLLEEEIGDDLDDFLDELESLVGRQLGSLGDLFCLEATKAWIPLRRNLGGAIDQAGAAQSARANRERAAGAATIRPPSTGDGGLAAR